MQRHIDRAVRAGLHQLLGAALLTPAAVALGLLILTEVTPERVLLLWVACLPASVLLAMTPLIQRLEVAALSELLDIDVPQRADRVYLVALTSVNLFGGATLSAGVLAMTPAFVRLDELWREAPEELAEALVFTATLLVASVAVGSRSPSRWPWVPTWS
ncbi:hypothetical protein [Micromonospora sp. NPDC005203]|uniref:hypothetical protein n=1 Tax=Micromonospora sp. NPDC005203 TaxID=3364226 RepID=UPI00369082FC